jgi:hypothetical protein
MTKILPNTGPSVGPITHIKEVVSQSFSLELEVHTDIAFALLAAVMTSAIVPPPRVSGAAPKVPAKKRKTIREFKELAIPQATLNITKRTLQIWYTYNRPYNSDMGAMTELLVSSSCSAFSPVRPTKGSKSKSQHID